MKEGYRNPIDFRQWVVHRKEIEVTHCTYIADDGTCFTHVDKCKSYEKEYKENQLKEKLNKIERYEDDDVELPTEVTHTFDYNGDNGGLEDSISDWLSDKYGYCHDGFIYEIIEDEK